MARQVKKEKESNREGLGSSGGRYNQRGSLNNRIITLEDLKKNPIIIIIIIIKKRKKKNRRGNPKEFPCGVQLSKPHAWGTLHQYPIQRTKYSSSKYSSTTVLL